MTRASKIPSSEWESYRTKICTYYNSHSLNETHDFMLAEHGFSANPKQYKRQLKIWGFRKYVPGEDMDLLIKLNGDRHMASGKKVTESHKKRYLRRLKHSQRSASQDTGNLHDTATSFSASLLDPLDDELLQPIPTGHNGLPYAALDTQATNDVTLNEVPVHFSFSMLNRTSCDYIHREDSNGDAATEDLVQRATNDAMYEDHDSQLTTTSHATSEGHSQDLTAPWFLNGGHELIIHDDNTESSGTEQCPSRSRSPYKVLGWHASASNVQSRNLNSPPNPISNITHHLESVFTEPASIPAPTLSHDHSHHIYSHAPHFSNQTSATSASHAHQARQTLDIARFTDIYTRKQDNIKRSLVQASSVPQVFRETENSNSVSPHHRHLTRLENVIRYQRNLTHAYAILVRLAKYGVLSDTDYSFINRVVKPERGWHVSSVAEVLITWIETYSIPPEGDS